MSQFIEFLQGEWAGLGPIIEGPRPTAAHEGLREFIPAEMFEVWDAFGFAGIDNGRFWLCDPLEWQEAADAWTETLDLVMDEDRWFPLFRSAFGDLELWGPRTGMSLSLVPIRGEVYPNDMSDLVAEPGGAVSALEGALMSYDEDSFALYDDQTEEPLFEACLAKLGPTSIDTMYTFAPVPALGGEATVGTAIIEKAVPHLLLLAGLEASDVRGDVSATQRQREARMDEWITGQD